MGTKINVTGSSESGEVQIRRRNSQGARTINRSFTIPIELDTKLEEEMVRESATKSLVATILMTEALEARQKG